MTSRSAPRPALRRRLAGVAGALVAALGLAGCYETPAPPCAFACALDGSCPSGYACDPQDKICHRQEPGGGLAACTPPFVDARVIDAPPVDAAVDATVDAPIDATVDAPVDASPDA